MVCSIVLQSVNSLILPPSSSIALINELITPVPISLKVRRGKRSDILQERREGLERKRTGSGVGQSTGWMGARSSAGEPWPQVLPVLSANSEIWPVTNVLPHICWKNESESNKESGTSRSVRRTTVRNLTQPWLWIWHPFASRFRGGFVLTSRAASAVSWHGAGPRARVGTKGARGAKQVHGRAPGGLLGLACSERKESLYFRQIRKHCGS